MIGGLLNNESDPAQIAGLALPEFVSELAKKGKEGDTTQPGKEGIWKSEGRDGETGPFILSEALPVVPARLVKKIQKGEYVEMAELLKDNMEVERRLQECELGPASRVATRREIPDMLSWLHCYSLYAAMVCSQYPEKAQDLWAYQATLIGEAKKCGGRGWYLYDAAFRQQIVSLQKTDFSKLKDSLYSTTFLAFGSRSRFCPNCMLSDHSQEECALSQFSKAGSKREWEREEPQVGSGEPRRRRRRGACYAWNDGNCSGPYCAYDHVCSKCYGNHRRSSCRSDRQDGVREATRDRKGGAP